MMVSSKSLLVATRLIQSVQTPSINDQRISLLLKQEKNILGKKDDV
jgi:hypothetical protein